MEDIKIRLNGIDYIKVEAFITPKTDNSEISNKCEKYECICQGVKQINQGGFFRDGYAIVNILVPEKNIVAYSKPIKDSEPDKKESLLFPFMLKFNNLGRMVLNLFTKK